MAGEPLSLSLRPASWPRLAAPSRCPGRPLVLAKPARGSSGRALVGAVFHIGTEPTLLIYPTRYYIDELGELHDETFTDKLEEQVNKQ